MSEDAADDQVQAAMLIARQRKFRLKTVVGLGVDRQARHLASLTLIPDAVAGRILIAYHLANRRPMMSRFLDALGVPHDEGVIQEDGPAPDASKLAPAAAEIGREFPLDEVRLYLNTLVCQDPETWGGLADLPLMQHESAGAASSFSIKSTARLPSSAGAEEPSSSE